MFPFKRLTALMAGLILSVSAAADDGLNLLSKQLTAGKALLGGDGFVIERGAGFANFSPGVRYPVQIIYRSNLEKTGIFGYNWYSPQLESSTTVEKDGVLWTAPWGEKIKFYAKHKADKDTLELYKEDMKGSNLFFAPYADWEADTPADKAKIAETGDWDFTGKGDYQNWRFCYRDNKLVSVSGPSGQMLKFAYDRDQLVKVTQDDQAMIELAYNGKLVSSLKVNGVEQKFAYSDRQFTVPPKTLDGSMLSFTRPALVSLTVGDTAPQTFAYGASGYLSQIRQGDAVENIVVETETLAERRQNLQSADKKSGVKHTGKADGRILSDREFTYQYSGEKNNIVTLTNQLGQTAVYDNDRLTGIFKVTEFSGKSSTIYYFMRYDVAYLGKVRQIVDGRDRVVVNYRYDKLTGKVTRIRDMAGNDTLLGYNKDGKVNEIARRAADEVKATPVARLGYDANLNLTEVTRLDQNGKPYQTSRMSYDNHRLLLQSDNGQNKTTLVYNKMGYPVIVTDAAGQVQKMEYDKYNRLTARVDVYGVRTEYTFNNSGKITKIEKKDGKELLSKLDITYDANGQVAAYLDQSGKVKKFERDAFGRLVKEFFPDETSVAYTYNAVGQLTNVSDQNRHDIKFDWSPFGLDAKTTAANQLTDYVYDQYGMLKAVESRYVGANTTDRSLRYEYDNLDRPVKITYGSGEVETFAYDKWGKLVATARGEQKATYQYDFFGRLTQKTENAVVNRYTYNQWGQRTSRETVDGAVTLSEKRSYDKLGRLTAIDSGTGKIEYSYNDKNQLARQTVNGIAIDFTYTKYGQLAGKYLGGQAVPMAKLQYFYSKDGMITGRMVDNELQNYTYDKKGQLLTVATADGKVVESYKYDAAGNILAKTVNGVSTSYTYDAANQLKSSITDKKSTNFAYDAAGRLVKENNKVYQYSGLDKVASISEGEKVISSYNYSISGQLASATTDGATENFLWDGLALIRRGDTDYTNEPYVTGGNPVVAGDKVLFNDILGNTVGIKSEDKLKLIQMTAFGETADKDAFFTGKPAVNNLGYSFLFRNYRADQGKWQTSDPLGYPDGLNNLAYGNNRVTSGFDARGGKWGNIDFLKYYYRTTGSDWIDTDVTGLTGDIWTKIFTTIIPKIKDQVYIQVRDFVKSLISNGTDSGSNCTTYTTAKPYSFGDICFALGNGVVASFSNIEYTWEKVDNHWEFYISNSIDITYSDIFKDVADIANLFETDIELRGGDPFSYGHTWQPYSYRDSGWIYE